jgi:hypothetical protein
MKKTSSTIGSKLSIVFVFVIFIACKKDDTDNEFVRNKYDSGVSELQTNFDLPFTGFSIGYGDTVQYPNGDDILPDFNLIETGSPSFTSVNDFAPMEVSLLYSNGNSSDAESVYDTVSVPGNPVYYPPVIVPYQVLVIRSFSGEAIKLLIISVEGHLITIDQFKRMKYTIKFKWERLRS